MSKIDFSTLTPADITPDLYRQFVGGLFHRNGDLSKDYAHAVLGVATELNEAALAEDPANFLEEAGDLLFFSVAANIVLAEHALAQGFGDQADYRGVADLLDTDDKRASVPAGAIAAGAMIAARNVVGSPQDQLAYLMDHAKKWVGYGSAPKTEEVLSALAACQISVTVPTIAAGFAETYPGGDEMSVDDALRLAAHTNIAKLRHRYKDGFSLQAAENRDLAGEREVLNAAVASAAS